jgi:hypothetical protein
MPRRQTWRPCTGLARADTAGADAFFKTAADYLDTCTGQVRRGPIDPTCREELRSWLERFAGRDDVTSAVESCTGWRFVVDRQPATFAHCTWLTGSGSYRPG